MSPLRLIRFGGLYSLWLTAESEQRKAKSESPRVIRRAFARTLIAAAVYVDNARFGLIGRHDALGVIVLEHEQGKGFSEDLMDFARLNAQELSLSVENASLYCKTKQLATQDGLTGVYNRMFLMDYLKDLFTSQPSVVSVILLDVDHFKLVNDQYGHLTGDVVLKKIAQLVQEKLPEGVLARYGGEEFVIVLTDMDQNQSYQFAEQIRELISQFPFVTSSGNSIQVTISAGLACYPLVSQNYEKLLQLADEALYEAKNFGRNRVSIARPAPQMFS